MGLRFRKSVTLCKGVRLNVGKTGVSISAGIPGFRKTIHSSGRVTTSVGIPGTGIYYVDTKNPSKKMEVRKNSGLFSTPFGGINSNKHPVSSSDFSDAIPSQMQDITSPQEKSKNQYEVVQEADIEVDATEAISVAVQHTNCVEQKNTSEITYDIINTIFENCDAAVDWIDVISHRLPTTDTANVETWKYLHRKAVEVFNENIDTYLEIISTINPYDDLLDYAENFKFSSDDATTMEVDFSIINSNVDNLKKSVFEDFYSAIAIRVARDTFALLPVENVKIHIIYRSQALLCATFAREKFQGYNFFGRDASDLIKQLTV